MHDKIFLGPVTTCHFALIQLMWPHHWSRCLPLQEWWAAFNWYIGQMIDKTPDQMNNCRLDNPCALVDQVERSNLQTTSSGKVKCSGQRSSSYGSDNLRAKIVLPSCRQYKPGDFLTCKWLNWVEMIHEDDDDESRVHIGALRSGRSSPGDGNDTDNGEGEE